MKNILFFIGGGLIGAWLFGQSKHCGCKKPAVVGAGTTDVVIPDVPQKEPIMPARMIQQYDASDHATVSPAMVTLYAGRNVVDNIDHNTAYLVSD